MSDLTGVSTEDLQEIAVALQQRYDLLVTGQSNVTSHESLSTLDRAKERTTELLGRVKEELSWR